MHIFNQDPTLAPPGKTSLVVMLPSNYEYWKELAQDQAAYEEKKDQVARTVVELLDQRFPGISEQVEMVDVATPLTFERYTGNWQGSFEGWLITPQNAGTHDEADEPDPARAAELLHVRAVGGAGRRAADGGDVGVAGWCRRCARKMAGNLSTSVA